MQEAQAREEPLLQPLLTNVTRARNNNAKEAIRTAVSELAEHYERTGDLRKARSERMRLRDAHGSLANTISLQTKIVEVHTARQ